MATAATGMRAGVRLEQVIEERYRSQSLRPEDALKLFDALLLRARPTSVSAFNKLLSVVARVGAESFSTVRDGPKLVVSLFNRMGRAGTSTMDPSICTYSIAIGCCCHVGRLCLSFAVFSKILKSGWRVNTVVLNQLVKGLRDVTRTSEAMDVVLH